MNKIDEFICWLYSEEGQTLVDYLLVLVLVSILMIFILTAMGTNVNNTYSRINNALP